MTFFDSICAIWKDDETMMSLLDVERFESGRVEDKLEDSQTELNVPYALLTLLTEDEMLGSSHGHHDEEIYEISFYFEKAYDARQARAAFRSLIRNADRERKFNHDEGRVVAVNKRSGSRKTEAGGVCCASDEWSVVVSK